MNNYGYFPFFIDIAGKTCLIVGGGNTALRKAEKLLQFGVNIKVVAPVIMGEIKTLSSESNGYITCEERAFVLQDLDNMMFVIGATNDNRLNTIISNECKKRKILVNIVDEINKCSFIFPALCKEKSLCIGITSGGASPAASKYIRQQIENIIPEGIGDCLDVLQKRRNENKHQITVQALRAHANEDDVRAMIQQLPGNSSDHSV